MTTTFDQGTVEQPRFMFERLFAGKLAVPLRVPPGEPCSFLRVALSKERDYPGRVNVCMTATCETCVVRDKAGGEVSLRNIRCQVREAFAFRLLRCGSCGWCDALVGVAPNGPAFRRCPGCGAEPVRSTCAMWHTYGVCAECTGVMIEECPFPATAAKDEVVVASHVPSA